jgi:hypothetical protein
MISKNTVKFIAESPRVFAFLNRSSIYSSANTYLFADTPYRKSPVPSPSCCCHAGNGQKVFEVKKLDTFTNSLASCDKTLPFLEGFSWFAQQVWVLKTPNQQKS